MKINKIQELEITDLTFKFELNCPSGKKSVTYSYTCPKCSGHGCRNTDGCINGIISTKLDYVNCKKIFEKEQISALKNFIKEIYDNFYNEPTTTRVI